MSEMELPSVDTLRVELSGITDLVGLDAWEKKYFGKQGLISNVSRSLKDLPENERTELGKRIAGLRAGIDALLLETRQRIQETAWQEAALEQNADLSASVPLLQTGSFHPLTLTIRRLGEIFASLGFAEFDGYELESDFFNFEALNIPADHPAREEHDTFYVNSPSGERELLRTHTSPAQIRLLREHGAPLRAIIPGRVFRNEATDDTHEHTFHQCEGFLVDKNVSVANMIFVIETALKGLYGPDVRYRWRPNRFPFVEPGFEVDILQQRPDGKEKWLEVLGCGMIHPHVLRAGGLDPAEWSGFAFGLGVTRLCMSQFGITDIRLLLGGSPSFHSQFTRRA